MKFSPSSNDRLSLRSFGTLPFGWRKWPRYLPEMSIQAFNPQNLVKRRISLVWSHLIATIWKKHLPRQHLRPKFERHQGIASSMCVIRKKIPKLQSFRTWTAQQLKFILQNIEDTPHVKCYPSWDGMFQTKPKSFILHVHVREYTNREDESRNFSRATSLSAWRHN